MARRVLGASALSLALLFSPAARAGEDGKAPEEGTPAPAKTADAEPSAAPGDGAAARGGKAAKTARKAAPATPLAVRRPPRSKAEALRLLDRVVVSVRFEDTPLQEALEHLSILTGVNIVVGPALREEGGAEALRFDLRLARVSARQALDLMVSGRDLGIGFRGSVLTVTTPAEARGKPVLRLYPIGDMRMPIRDFPAPDLMLRPPGAEREVEEPTETQHPYGDADDILRMMMEHTGTGTWEDDGVSASTMGDWIVVKQYEEVHAEIARLLRLLRSAR